MSKLLTIGVIGKSLKENEKRVAIHPAHLKNIPKNLRRQITFEKGYGRPFGYSDDYMARTGSGRLATRNEILEKYDCILLPKPVLPDFEQVHSGAVMWGWPHCVEHPEITQLAIDKKLTLIAWENMFIRGAQDEKILHIFYKNNELAGYAGVNHALGVMGITGQYGASLKAAVISFGSVSRGAVYALQGQGIQDITVFTERPATQVGNQLPGMVYRQMTHDASGRSLVIDGAKTIPFIEAVSNKQIIVNGTLQDTDHPRMFINEKESERLMPGTLIIDVSCDAGMGFWCARPTSFESPVIETGAVFYYAVDHTPSYYWRSATLEISKALLPFLSSVIHGQPAWIKDKTINKAIDVEQGIIRNPKILSFQNRSRKYPHPVHGKRYLFFSGVPRSM